MKIIPDYDENGRRLSKKEKDNAKSTAGAIGCLLIFTVYYHLWKDGNLKQRFRMLISWILFFATLSLNPDNLEYSNWETGYSFPGTSEEYEALKENYETWFGLLFIVWIAFVFYSWYKRSKEN